MWQMGMYIYVYIYIDTNYICIVYPEVYHYVIPECICSNAQPTANGGEQSGGNERFAPIFFAVDDYGSVLSIKTWLLNLFVKSV